MPMKFDSVTGQWREVKNTMILKKYRKVDEVELLGTTAEGNYIVCPLSTNPDTAQTFNGVYVMDKAVLDTQYAEVIQQ